MHKKKIQALAVAGVLTVGVAGEHLHGSHLKIKQLILLTQHQIKIIMGVE
ncbi:hypothetical protein QJS64_17585 [Paraclostridium bifermentans]|uniref:Uncharacterized protein n=1 Tax=Paraclostridium bifermentans TaxID=1490 RepID=A0ABY8R4D8_PARBF|nr:hypothetical protein QJS64_17585 [Paraclostridium bifermentans]